MAEITEVCGDVKGPSNCCATIESQEKESHSPKPKNRDAPMEGHAAAAGGQNINSAAAGMAAGDAPHNVTFNEDKHTLESSRDGELLSPLRRSALEYALERSPDTSAAPNTLYVANSQDSAAVMQRLGLHAVTSDGLETLTLDDIRSVFDADQSNDSRWRYFLLLADFDIARLDSRPTLSIGKSIERLVGAAGLYNIDLGRRFGVFRPSAEEFHLLESATTFADSARTRKLFESWAAPVMHVPISKWQTRPRSQTSYSKARRALTRALQESDYILRRAAVLEALQPYREAGQIAVIEKFGKAVDGATDAFGRRGPKKSTTYFRSVSLQDINFNTD